MVPFPGPSHWLWMSKFADELLERGHELTVVTAFKKPTGPHPNYTEILMDPVYDFSVSCKLFFISKLLYLFQCL